MILGGNSGEVFVLSGRDESESIVKNGTFAGLGINEALSRLGGEEDTPDNNFPLYIKALNTVERLPVKVYPDDEYAALHGNKKGKISLIYIVDCKKGAEIVYGLSRNVSPDELKSRVKGGSLSAICNFVGVQKGDVFFVPPGVVFAIGGGISALEISTNSDSEYIISDYGRVDSYGKPRPLQIDRALDVMKQAAGGELEQAVTWLNLADLETAEKGYEEAEESIQVCLDRARLLLDTPSLPRNGYYAYVVRCCAPTFEYYGRFMDAQELEEISSAIYRQQKEKA